MKLSIVTTMYYSAPYIEEFHRRITETAEKITDDYEIIFVNDGSPDNSLEAALRIYEKDKKVKIIDLSRNFGHHKAMMRGLAHARGEKIFLIDCDLEESPEWMISFSKQMDKDNCDVVYGVQERRKGGVFERLSGAFAYLVFNIICDINTDKNIVTARMMTKRYVDALMCYNESESVFTGLCSLAGFEQHPQIVKKNATSPTTYTITRKIALVVDMITSFSTAPLRAIFYTGVTIFTIATIYAGYLFINRVFFAKPLDGWTSIMVSIWLLGGLIVSFIGIIGIYLCRIFIETKRRPNTITRKVYEQ